MRIIICVGYRSFAVGLSVLGHFDWTLSKIVVGTFLVMAPENSKPSERSKKTSPVNCVCVLVSASVFDVVAVVVVFVVQRQ